MNVQESEASVCVYKKDTPTPRKNMSNSSHDKLVKLLLVGSSGSGKTTALLQHCESTFSGTFIPTIGIDFKVKNVKVNDTLIKAQIWDTAGQERFRTITTAYYRGAHGIFLFYSVADNKSFEMARDFLSSIEKHAPTKIPLILVGTFADSSDNRKVSYADGVNFATSVYAPDGVPFYEISSKSKDDVDAVFEHMYEMAAEVRPCRYESTPIPWEKSLHSHCINIQKNAMELVLIYLRCQKDNIPNDVVLHIFHFLRVAKHDREW